jgi:hypothetical protein
VNPVNKAPYKSSRAEIAYITFDCPLLVEALQYKALYQRTASLPHLKEHIILPSLQAAPLTLLTFHQNSISLAFAGREGEQSTRL